MSTLVRTAKMILLYLLLNVVAATTNNSEEIEPDVETFYRRHMTGESNIIPTMKELEQLQKSMRTTEEVIHFLEKWRKEEVNVAVLGKSAVGKSSFINKIRNVKRGDEGFASVGLGDETRRPTRYSMPKDEHIALWDMPGIGTLFFKMNEQYLEKTIQVNNYDFFLILYCTAIEEGDIWLIKQLIKRNKPFAVVRTKADELLDENLGDSFAHHAEKVKENFRNNTRNAGVTRKTEIFVISSKNLSLGEFDCLFKFLLKQLPMMKEMAMVMSIEGFTPEIIMKKKEILKTRKWYAAALIGGISAVPYLKIEVPVNIAILKNEIETYLSTFSLRLQNS